MWGHHPFWDDTDDPNENFAARIKNEEIRVKRALEDGQ
jgi:hypothetical protein